MLNLELEATFQVMDIVLFVGVTAVIKHTKDGCLGQIRFGSQFERVEPMLAGTSWH